MTYILFVIVFLFSPLATQATELYENYVSARAAGMGNSYTSIVEDKDALFYNPAALTKVNGFNLTIMDPAISTDAQDAYTIGKNISDSNSTTVVGDYFGRQIYIGAFGSTGVWIRGFGAVLYDSANISLDIRNPAFPKSNISATNDYGFIGGMAFSLVPGVLHWGISGKRVTRYGLRTTLGASTLTNISTTAFKDILKATGTGYGLDTGLMLTFPSPVNPTLTLVWKDIGQTKFIPLDATYGTPPVQDNEFVAGFGMTVDATVLKIRPSIDFKHINLWEEQLGKKLHFGTEIAFPLVSVRGGFNQGYYTFGAGVDLWWLRVDAASYGVELDTYPGQREDRRYMAQVTLQINIDPDFKFLNGNNTPGGFKPKQRR